MSVHDPKDTLAYHASRPLCIYRDMSGVPCQKVAQAVSTSMQLTNFKLANPERSALRFYFLNHGKSIIARKRHPLEPLDEFDLAFVEAYHRNANEEAIRAFYYLLLICTRETRHVGDSAEIYKKCSHDFGLECAAFNKAIKNLGSEGSYQRFLNKPPNATIGDYVKSLQFLFYNGYFSPGFGGPAWGAIADCLVNFVTGIYSPEMMLDVVFTLCHNNGAIFNKGMFYEGYTHTLYRILDIQRSGQIAEACLDDHEIGHYVSSDLSDAIDKFKVAHPGEFGEYVDWYAVEAHGALHGPYHTEKVQQAAIHGLTEAQKSKMTAMEKAKIKAAQLKAEAAKQFAKENFEYWPGQFAKVLPQPKSRAA